MPHQMPADPNSQGGWYSKLLLFTTENAFSRRNSVVNGDEVFIPIAKANLLQNTTSHTGLSSESPELRPSSIGAGAEADGLELSASHITSPPTRHPLLSFPEPLLRPRPAALPIPKFLGSLPLRPPSESATEIGTSHRWCWCFKLELSEW